MTSRKTSSILGLFSVFFFMTPVPDSFSNPLEKKSAEALYMDGKYKESETKFEQEYSENPEDSRIAYNLANSAYKSGDFENALTAYDQASSLARDKTLQQRSFYNSGNTLFRMGKLEEAVEQYRKALKLDSSDMDAKFNLEFVREQIKKKKEEKKKKESQQNKDGDSSSNSSSPKGDESQEKQQKPKPEPGKGNPSEKQQAKPSDQKPNSNNPQTNPVQQGKMTKEEAERRLNSLNENRKEFVKRQLAKKQPSASSPQDW